MNLEQFGKGFVVDKKAVVLKKDLDELSKEDIVKLVTDAASKGLTVEVVDLGPFDVKKPETVVDLKDKFGELAYGIFSNRYTATEEQFEILCKVAEENVKTRITYETSKALYQASCEDIKQQYVYHVRTSSTNVKEDFTILQTRLRRKGEEASYSLTIPEFKNLFLRAFVLWRDGTAGRHTSFYRDFDIPMQRYEVTIFTDGIRIGCQNILRYEAEALALYFGFNGESF